jgi:ribosomal protein S12 methylthiotransferase
VFTASELSFFIISLGCSKNLVDSELINGEMISAGFTSSESADDSDIIIINTCGFIQDAKEESIETILDAIDLKKNASNDKILKHQDFKKKIVAVGCLTKRYFSEIEKEIPEIDFLYGIKDEKFVSALCHKFNIKHKPILNKRKKLYNASPFSYIKISDGCSNNCSYCAIPIIRGPHVPFSPEQILKDAEYEAANGALELNIIAQDIAIYKWETTDLTLLVNNISKINNLKWIRLLYCHPDHITDKIINLIAENEKVVPYIDIPFQHVNETLLKSMGRKGSTGKYLNLIEKLRKKIPQISIRSTFMLGYPGEDEKIFSELLDFIKTAEIDKVGCFIFSPEEGTKAYNLSDDVSINEKNKRLDEIMSIQAQISQKKLNEKISLELDVLVEEKIDEKTYIGRTIFDAPEVDGIFFLTADINKINEIVRAKVTDSIEYDLIGEML